MPLLHCKSCHHEWEGQRHSKCDWCDDEGKVIMEKTGLEQMLSNPIHLNNMIRKLAREKM